MTIELNDVQFYRNGKPGATRIVGNETDTPEGRLVVRYTFTVPEPGAARVNITFRIGGVDRGAAIPIRFHIGTDPESHVNAGPDAPYIGELVLAENQFSFSAEARVPLMPGRTYYIWAFPGNDQFGYYYWNQLNAISVLETSGAAFLLPVALGGVWRRIMLHVAIGGKWLLIAPCVVQDGKWHYIGSA